MHPFRLASILGSLDVSNFPFPPTISVVLFLLILRALDSLNQTLAEVMNRTYSTWSRSTLFGKPHRLDMRVVRYSNICSAL